MILGLSFGIPIQHKNTTDLEGWFTHTRLDLHWVEHYIVSNAVYTDVSITLLGLDDLQVTVDSSWPIGCDMNTCLLYSVEIGSRQ